MVQLHLESQVLQMDLGVLLLQVNPGSQNLEIPLLQYYQQVQLLLVIHFDLGNQVVL